MLIPVGHVEALFRYPVKSMEGEALECATLGWHGIEGDRRLAIRRVNDHSGFPWLTATKLPELILYTPLRLGAAGAEDLPAHVRTPDGHALPIFSPELADDIARRYGSPIEMMHVRHGVFDDASISVIASDTVREITALAGQSSDVRRFRPNILVRSLRPGAFQEDEWLGGALSFGDGEDAPCVAVTMRDLRCAMINLDPDTATPHVEMMKASVRANQNHAGIYGTVTRSGRIEVGQPIYFRPEA